MSRHPALVMTSYINILLHLFVSPVNVLYNINPGQYRGSGMNRKPFLPDNLSKNKIKLKSKRLTHPSHINIQKYKKERDLLRDLFFLKVKIRRMSLSSTKRIRLFSLTLLSCEQQFRLENKKIRCRIR